MHQSSSATSTMRAARRLDPSFSQCTTGAAVLLSVSFLLSGTSALIPSTQLCRAGFGVAKSHSGMHRAVTLLPRRAQAAGVSRLNMAMMDNRPDQSGDEEGKSQEGQLGKEINNTLVEAFVPNTVSQTQLQYMACKLRLKDVVEIQDFQKAAEIKNTMDHLESEEMKVLFSKVLHESKQMREQKERRRNKNDLTEDLEQAIAEEDFDLAQSIKDRMETASARSKSAASRLPLLRRIDMVWIESEIGSRILQARAREEERLKDPITRLEVNLKAALEEELFEEAAVIRDQLRSEHHDQDIRKMHRDLKRQLTFKAAELDRLKRNPVMYLSHQFQLAVNAEDYELAATLFKELTSAETRKMYEVLNKQVKSQEEKKMRRSKATQMENELDQSIAEEDFEMAAKIRDQILANDKHWNLQLSLQDAEKTGRFEEAQTLKQELIDMYTSEISSPMLSAMGYQYETPTFKVGQPVFHKKLGFRGVILGWHESCRASESWISHHGVDQLRGGENAALLPHPAGHARAKSEDMPLWIGDCSPAFLCGRDPADRLPFMQTGYIAEEELRPLVFEQCSGVLASVLKPLKSIISGSTPVQHPLIPFYFVSFRGGKYRPDRRLRDVLFYHIPEWADEGSV
eukprot:CAMPEP_0181313536 /NCGR_PEP_ID=MMETSP1101-20121128/14299_1 /TAXON_ID=46948 /ORGANISM="Rhodomonas abbreviata, Strain Caron Lab Isolate" /LENGTH=627 /DNA_ID=CAMNT_0023420493 /DNA_START=205 /DNA_END=2087 /DNA_ORIENTATION=+